MTEWMPEMSGENDMWRGCCITFATDKAGQRAQNADHIEWLTNQSAGHLTEYIDPNNGLK